MFRRILVPVDDTRRAVEAVDVARRLAERLHAEVVLVRVEETVVDMRELTQDRQEMEKLVLALHDAGIAARHYVEFGPTDTAIADSAGFQHADLIVLAPHRRDWLETVRHPSVTLRLLRRSPAPLLIWPGEGPGKAFSNFLGLPTSCVIVPLDGSDLAERALPFAMNLAQEYVRPLMLVRAVPPATLAGPEARRLELRLEAREHEEASRYLSALRDRLAGGGAHHVNCAVLRGTLRDEIPRVAEEYAGSVVVLSIHGRGGLGRLFLGSVTAHLVHVANVPLLVVPPHAASTSVGSSAARTAAP